MKFACGMLVTAVLSCESALGAETRIQTIDRDTFDARFHVAGVNTRETHHARCEVERIMGERAAAFTRDWLAEHARRLTLEVVDIDRFGPLVAPTCAPARTTSAAPCSPPATPGRGSGAAKSTGAPNLLPR